MRKEEWKKDIWGEKERSKIREARGKDKEREGGRFRKGARWRFSMRGNSHERDRRVKNKEQEQRTICAALVTVHVIQKTQLQSIYEVQTFKCLIG